MSDVPDEASFGPVNAAANEPDLQPQRLTLITGLSGAGLSVALKALEDQGYEAIDNLRLALVPPLVQAAGEGERRPLAIVVDSRTRDFHAAALLRELEALRARPELEVDLVFLECGNEVLRRRFTETRRRHPLATDRRVADGIQLERTLLDPVKSVADVVIDTTTLSLHDLRRLMATQFALGETPALTVFVTSFSFRQGLPREADLVFDVRFLKNPHWDAKLRPMSGLDREVDEHVASDPDFMLYFSRLTGLLEPLLPRYTREGKSYLTIAVGCTGGRHRSVAVAERLTVWLDERGVRVMVNHRDLTERGGERRGAGEPEIVDRPDGRGVKVIE